MDLNEKGTRCWKGYEKKGTKKLFGKTVPNCVKKEEIELTDIEENLRNWVKQKWVDISRKKKGGGHPACGASAGKKSRAGGKRAYPKCVPAGKAASMSKKDKESATRRKRAAYKGKGKPSKKPKMVSTEQLKEINRLVEKNKTKKYIKRRFSRTTGRD